MTYKVFALVGIFFSLAGAILLWRSSPSSSGLGAYASSDLLQQIAAQGRRMQRRQNVAIALVVVGAFLQVPLLLCG
jgi:hypothetical protein